MTNKWTTRALKRVLATGLLAALLLVAIAVSGSGCASYTVYIHDRETDYNHYVLLRNGAIRETLWDCYSRPGKKWDPTCVRVKMQRTAQGGD